MPGGAENIALPMPLSTSRKSPSIRKISVASSAAMTSNVTLPELDIDGLPSAGHLEQLDVGAAVDADRVQSPLERERRRPGAQRRAGHLVEVFVEHHGAFPRRGVCDDAHGKRRLLRAPEERRQSRARC